MAKFIFLTVCCLFCGRVSGATWHMENGFTPHDPLICAGSPAVYPDTLCIISGWTPLYTGFGIQEGMFYAGIRNMDLTLRMQYHPMMINSSASMGFPLLKEKNIRAGLQIHYGMSSITGSETLHAGSCSGAVLVCPDSGWTIGFETRHLLAFPQDTLYTIFEAENHASLGYMICPQLRITGSLCKQAGFPWQYYFQCDYTPWNILSFALSYEFVEQDLFLGLRISPGRWSAAIRFNFHKLLGLSQSIYIAYAY